MTLELLRWLHVGTVLPWLALLLWLRLLLTAGVEPADREPGLRLAARGLRLLAAAGWLAGLGLLFGVYYRTSLLFESGHGWSPRVLALAAAVLLLPPLLQRFHTRRVAPALLLVVGAALLLAAEASGLGSRAAGLHLGALLGGVMAWDALASLGPGCRRLASQPADQQLRSELARRLALDLSLGSAIVLLMLLRHQPWLGSPARLMAALASAWLLAGLTLWLGSRPGLAEETR